MGSRAVHAAAGVGGGGGVDLLNVGHHGDRADRHECGWNCGCGRLNTPTPPDTQAPCTHTQAFMSRIHSNFGPKLSFNSLLPTLPGCCEGNTGGDCSRIVPPEEEKVEKLVEEDEERNVGALDEEARNVEALDEEARNVGALVDEERNVGLLEDEERKVGLLEDEERKVGVEEEEERNEGAEEGENASVLAAECRTGVDWDA